MKVERSWTLCQLTLNFKECCVICVIYINANILWLPKHLDFSVPNEKNIALNQITWTVVPAMLCIHFHAKHPENKTQVELKVFDLDLTITNQPIGVSLHQWHCISDWKITLINQTDSVDDLSRRESSWQYELDTFQPSGLKGELHSNYIFLHFALIGLEWDSITLSTKINFFSSKTHI